MSAKNRLLFAKQPKISVICAVLSIFTLLCFHLPFFRYVLENTSKGLNGILIVVCLTVIMLLCNFFFYYLLIYLFRFVGKCIVAFTFIGDAVSLYFINNYDVIIDDTMMGNVFNTKFIEASGFFSWSAVLYVLILGILPCVYIFARKIDYGSLKRFFANVGFSILGVAALAFANMPNWMWIDNNSTVMGSLLLPWSYTVNTFRYQNSVRERNREEIRLPDLIFEDTQKSAVILVIGESVRTDHIGLLGYERNTTPELASIPGVRAFPGKSAATYTTAAVKAILDYKETDDLYEILPNYLYRNGAEVIWRSSNWGEPPLHIEKNLSREDLAKIYPDADPDHDGILFEGLRDEILGCGKDKVLIVLHTYISHGPSYNRGYPDAFMKFEPICNTVEMASADHDELMNSYDNTILYTDYLLSETIGMLKGLEGWKTGLVFLSDHGESLGEGNLYMHGVPMAIAPREQYEIPFILWSSDPEETYKPAEELNQYQVFHSILHFLGAYSPIYDESRNFYVR